MAETAHSSAPSGRYPRFRNPLTGLLRSLIAWPLLVLQLTFTLFILELPCWIADRLFAKNRGNAFYWAQRTLARWFFRLLPFGWQRRTNIRKDAFPEPCIIVCNHQSVLDLLLCSTLPVNARWFLRPWLLRIPLFGELNKLARHMVSAEDEADSLRPTGYSEALEWLQQGVSVLVFAEGGRSRDGNLLPFKQGPFALAIEAGVPVVPLVLDGTGAALPKGGMLLGHPDLALRAMPPVSPPESPPEDQLPEAAAQLRDRVRLQMQTELEAMRDGKKRRRDARVHGWLTRLAMFGAAVVLAFVVGLSAYVENFCIAEPPVYDGSRELLGTEVASVRLGDERVQTIGRNWRRTRHGVHELGLVGDPWERGYANARLTPELLKQQEDHLLDTAREFVPNRHAYWLLKHAIAVNNRRLPEFVTHREQLEVLGLTEGGVDHHPDDVPLYHRVLNYHAAHDISHLLIDNPLVARAELIGCSAFAAWGDASADGQLMVARNFDWEAGEIFDLDKCVIYVWPDEGIPYVHVAWAGMAGAVTGMNAEGLSIHLNAARTDDFRWGRVGTPVSMLTRRVLEQASTIDEALAIIEQADVFVSDSFLVASRADGRAVVIEKSPSHTTMREAARPGLLLQTNHFLDAHWADDQANRDQQHRATSLYRWQRLEELTDRHYGSLGRDTALAILRDRKGTGDKELGYGNRNAIDAAICTHSVIMNVTTGEMWVSTGPGTFGRYIHVPVRRMLEAQPEGAMRMRLSADDDLPRAADYTRGHDIPEFRQALRTAARAVRRGDKNAAEGAVRTLRNLNPQAFETHYYEGRLHILHGRHAQAADAFEAALERDPHYAEVREDIRNWLNRADSRR
jgi:isopenicillin-N N-acyltransferase like protein